MYFPYQKGRYEVAPGLYPLAKDFGNGEWDQRVLQVDDVFRASQQFEINRAREKISKYVCLASDADPRAIGAIVEWIAAQLANGYPSAFSYAKNDLGFIFSSKLTNEILEINPADNFVNIEQGNIEFESPWDAMGAQVQEDLAIWRLNPDGS